LNFLPEANVTCCGIGDRVACGGAIKNEYGAKEDHHKKKVIFPVLPKHVVVG
jgi:hypothetical protein